MKLHSKDTTCIEICCVLLGEYRNGIWHAKLSWEKSGSHEAVEFDGRRVLEREERFGDVVGFYHTHPEGFCQFSERDRRTMYAWCFSFGKPLICAIGTSQGVKAWLFEPEKEHPEECRQVSAFKRNWFVATMR